MDSTTKDRRAAFLLGEGTLTAQEVREWAADIGSRYGMPLPLDGEVPPSTALMVAVRDSVAYLGRWSRSPKGISIDLTRPAAHFLRGTVAHMNQAKTLPKDTTVARDCSSWLEEIEAAVTGALGHAHL